MKMTQKAILLLSLLCSTALPQGLALAAENYINFSDMDGVVLNLPVSQYPVIAYKCVKQMIHNRHDLIDVSKTLYYTWKEIKGIRDEDGNRINGLTPQMLEIGMRHKKTARFIAPFLEIVEDARQLDHNVIKTLKTTGLEIIWATNKDSLTYQKAAKKHGLDTIATKAIVTKHPLSQKVLEFAHHADTPASYRQLAEQYHNDKETETIIHAPDKKPSAAYYQCMKEHSQGKKIIFIDDTKKNIAGFNKYLPEDIAIHYKGNPDQLATQVSQSI